MSNNTTRKVKLNFIFGIAGQIVTLVIGIIVPRLFITSFGSEVNGFINSLNQVFVYVALLEAGVGAASLQKLYTPAGKNDRTEINKILSATNYYYNKVGMLYLIIVIVLAFVYPLMVKSILNYWLMVTLVLLSGISGALPYFFQAKYKLLLQAEGKDYVISTLATVSSILLSTGKLLLLLLGCNVIAVQSAYIVINLCISIIYVVYIKRKYNWIVFKKHPDLSVISQKNSVLLHQISTLIFSNTDILILTFYTDLTLVSIYVLYKNLISIILGVLSTFSSSFSFRLGQCYEERNRFLYLNDMFEPLYISLSFALMTITYIFLTPFLSIYTEGMDANYLIQYVPLLFCLMEVLNNIRTPSLNMITYAGHFKQTQRAAVAEAAINLISSIVLVRFWGINGVITGSILALVYRSIDMIVYVNKKLLGRTPWHVVRILLCNICVSTIVILISRFLSFTLDSYFKILLVAGITCIIAVPIYVLVGYLGNLKSGKDAYYFLSSLLSKKKVG